MPGIQKVEVSLRNNQVIIYSEKTKHIPTATVLNKQFIELGYTFSEKAFSEAQITNRDIYKILAISTAFIAVFLLFERSDLFMRVSLTSKSSLLSYFTFGLAAGVSSCAALIGGLLLALSKNWNSLYNNNKKKSITPFIYFNLSRVVTFALLGGLLGYLGSFISISITFTSILTLAIALLMIIVGLQMVGIKWVQRFKFGFSINSKYLDKNKNLQGKYIPLVVGALTFFVPCGFTLIAQTNALNSGSFTLGLAQLTTFSLGTLPILALISFSSMKFYANPSFSRKFSLMSGIIIVFFGLYTINSQLNVLGLTSLNDLKLSSNREKTNQTVKTNSENMQIMQMEASGFDYYPKVITIKSGVKTKWEIYDSGAVGCARAVYARGLYPDVIQLSPGLNTVEFIAPKPGNYKISCSMGMVAPITVEVI